jgi:hypothetical protein
MNERVGRKRGIKKSHQVDREGAILNKNECCFKETRIRRKNITGRESKGVGMKGEKRRD